MRSLFKFAALMLCGVHGLHGQDTVCDLFKDLKASDGKQIALSGELAIYDNGLTVLASADCDRQYSSERNLWNAALELRASADIAPTDLDKLKAAAAEMSRLRNSDQLMMSQATVSGRLRVGRIDSFPAEFVFDSVTSVKVEALPDAKDLPVLSICDLFQNLESWRGKRIAVRGEFAATGEGNWIFGRCDGAFSTNGYVWPVSLSYAPPTYTPNFQPSLEELGVTNNGGGRWSFDPRPHTATFIGRLQLRDEYVAVCESFGEYRTNGFDHLGGATGRLLVETILDVENGTWPTAPASYNSGTQKCQPDQNKPR